MPHRVSPADRVRGHIDELFASGRQLPEILEDVAQVGAQLLMQAALEAEITEFPGRDRYQRAAACADARTGSRNGYREVTVKTTAGPVTLARPKLRGTTEAFASRLFGSRVTRTNALETLVIASFVRGLSVRDVEAALAEALGDQAEGGPVRGRTGAGLLRHLGGAVHPGVATGCWSGQVRRGSYPDRSSEPEMGTTAGLLNPRPGEGHRRPGCRPGAGPGSFSRPGTRRWFQVRESP